MPNSSEFSSPAAKAQRWMMLVLVGVSLLLALARKQFNTSDFFNYWCGP